MIKWLAILAAILLPFSFHAGIADWRSLVVAAVAGVLWIATSAYYWKHESPLAAGFALLIGIGAYHFGNSFYDSEPPFGIFLQWLAAFLVVAAMPVIFFRKRLREYCGLNEAKSQEEGCAEASCRPESE